MTGEDILRVDTDLLARLGAQLQAAAAQIPDPPEAFVVSGQDAISQAIAAKLPDLEDPILQGLPEVKASATRTADSIVSAAQQYASTDERLAADYYHHQFDGAAGGSPTAGPVGGGPGGTAPPAGGPAAAAPVAGGGSGGPGMQGALLGSMGQLTQLSQQVLGAVTSGPQAVTGTLGQLGQVAGGTGRHAAPDAAAAPSADPPGSPEPAADDAAGAQPGGPGESVPPPVVGGPAPSGAPRHAAADGDGLP